MASRVAERQAASPYFSFSSPRVATVATTAASVATVAGVIFTFGNWRVHPFNKMGVVFSLICFCLAVSPKVNKKQSALKPIPVGLAEEMASLRDSVAKLRELVIKEMEKGSFL